MAYLLGMDHVTFYLGSRLMRQMGHSQGLPLAGALFEDTLISSWVTVAIRGSWTRGAHVVEAGVSKGRTAAYEVWCIAEHSG
ncbi:hypothetical protein JCGZ_22291 [Jatropha curcas]|uniref:Uncharacterized protein n=1 Tax=Jatropha curcas TaxID=180498 RepID=A0A067JQU0_JATCU|nr:hypothetical protein JCGZ_22291 [Jatropha curcas]